MVDDEAFMALSERARELATLRVIGFTRGEISSVLLGELAVLTAVAVATHDRIECRLTRNRVTFRALTEHEVQSYCGTSEPMDKAGAYAIQGKAAVFVERLEGSYSAVMGLPLCETAELLRDAGIEIFEL